MSKPTRRGMFRGLFGAAAAVAASKVPGVKADSDAEEKVRLVGEIRALRMRLDDALDEPCLMDEPRPGELDGYAWPDVSDDVEHLRESRRRHEKQAIRFESYLEHRRKNASR